MSCQKRLIVSDSVSKLQLLRLPVGTGVWADGSNLLTCQHHCRCIGSSFSSVGRHREGSVFCSRVCCDTWQSVLLDVRLLCDVVCCTRLDLCCTSESYIFVWACYFCGWLRFRSFNVCWTLHRDLDEVWHSLRLVGQRTDLAPRQGGGTILSPQNIIGAGHNYIRIIKVWS